MIANASRPCPVCSSSKVDVLHNMKFELPASSPLPSHYRVVSCEACGMVYADSESSQNNYDKYYEQFSKYEDTKTASGGGYTPSDRARLDEMASVIVKHLKPSDSIVDIGCANGGLLEALSDRGFTNLTGIDPSPVSIQHIQQRGFKGYNSIISELNKEEVGIYNAIIISHVLEHIFDVATAMDIMRSLLDEQGLLYIEVPDALHYSHHYVVPFYYFDPEHINHFDYHALENLAGMHGFDIISWSEKNINISANLDYPAVYAIFRKQPQKPLTKLICLLN